MHLTRPLTLSRRRSRRGSGARAQAAISPGRERNQRANVSQDAALVQLLLRVRLQGRRDDLGRLPALRVRAGLVARSAPKSG